LIGKKSLYFEGFEWSGAAELEAAAAAAATKTSERGQLMAPPLPPPLLAPGDEPGQQPPRVQHSTGRPTCARQSDFSSQLESRNRWGGLLLAVEAFAREHERQGRRELRAAAIELGSIQCFDCSLLAGSKLKARSEREIDEFLET